MRRTRLLAGLLPFVSAFPGSVLAFELMVPGMVAAQAHPRGVADYCRRGTDRLRLASKWDGQASDLSLLEPDGLC